MIEIMIEISVCVVAAIVVLILTGSFVLNLREAIREGLIPQYIRMGIVFVVANAVLAAVFWFTVHGFLAFMPAHPDLAAYLAAGVSTVALLVYVMRYDTKPRA
jgi:hypothetical protein